MQDITFSATDVWGYATQNPACTSCDTAFSWTLREHQCGLCGRAVCRNCSRTRLRLPGRWRSLRVCSRCGLQQFQAAHGPSEPSSDVFNTVTTTSSSTATSRPTPTRNIEVNEAQIRLELQQRCRAAEARTLELEAQLHEAEENKLEEMRLAESLVERTKHAEETVEHARALAAEAERRRDEAEASSYWRMWRSETREAAAESRGSMSDTEGEHSGVAKLKEANAQLEARLAEATRDIAMLREQRGLRTTNSTLAPEVVPEANTLDSPQVSNMVFKNSGNPTPSSFGPVRLQAEACDTMEGWVELKRQRRWVVRYVMIPPVFPAYLVYGETRQEALLATRGDFSKVRRILLAEYEVQYAGTDNGMHMLSVLPLASGRPRYLLRFEHRGICDEWLGSLHKAKIGASSFQERCGVRDWATL